MNLNEHYADKKTLVTGGAGFIGAHLCEGLLDCGAEVYCLDNFSAGHLSNIKEFFNNPKFHIIAKDVCDRDGEMELLFEGLHAVFNNAASKKNICLANPQKDLQVNAGGTLNLLELAMKHGVSKFVHASTGSVYGEPSLFPTTEAHPLAPVSYYGVSKLAGERYVDVFHRLYGLDTTILRYFHVYGPKQESNEFGGVVSIFLRKIIEGNNPVVFGHGEQVRSFTWVKDLVTANLRAGAYPSARGKAYNAASGIRVTINELANNMIKYMSMEKRLCVEHAAPLVGDIMEFDVSNEAIRKDLNIEFNQDFWGTLEFSIRDSKHFLNR
ncbi:UDP-glucose 4-epimerase [Thiothrix eikelboomii]|uniref:UDP-glucose 4-epimerase n=1 Tax=Thiothrix eikelboomii TaxID=92487 RepID=A0A1T4XIU5_9GAMM|nr:NAD-dependent epimerase/dehydratase family protein [Thiothrix eikelboomii]SKA89502.1 UDP-glucose 4-epimerase [Thiothrix eikelboomii]